MGFSQFFKTNIGDFRLGDDFRSEGVIQIMVEVGNDVRHSYDSSLNSDGGLTWCGREDVAKAL